MTGVVRRPDRLVDVELAALRHLPLGEALRQPETAIALLTADLPALWRYHRSDDWGRRRIGRMQLASGAYSRGSDTPTASPSSARVMRTCTGRSPERAGRGDTGTRRLPSPADGLPNHWLEVPERSACAAAAYSAVAVLTALFRVYAG